MFFYRSFFAKILESIRLKHPYPCEKSYFCAVNFAMVMEYKDLSLSDKSLIVPLIEPTDRRNCDLSWSNLCSWRFLYATTYAILYGDTVLFRFRAGGERVYLMPVGRGDMKKALAVMRDECHEEGHPLVVYGVCEEHLPLFEEVMPGQTEHFADRAYADYLYLRTSLSTLSGKALQPKRNHVNKFLKTYPDWEYLPILPEHIGECLELERLWCIANGCDQNAGLGQERRAVTYALEHFSELGLSGGLLRVGGRIVAFTFGMPINHDTFGVHVEKADSSIDGAYAMINREFARRIPERFVYVNREEDLGLEGLRKAKLSYHPAILLNKYTVREKGGRS
jgi:hypothetical protein